MIRSMTGFGRARGFIVPWGRVSLEIRSVNHRFLDIIFHLPDSLLHLEQRLKEEISRYIKRGHVVCRLELNPSQLKKPVLNKRLIKEYYLTLRQLCRHIGIKEEVDINTLMGLPGVWSMQTQPSLFLGWAQIRPLVKEALGMVVKRRQREGIVLYNDLKKKVQRLGVTLRLIKARFRKVISRRIKQYKSEEEKNSFLKNSDINEEIVRLGSHLKNFTHCLKDSRAVGKELDFILQEMQREANTIGAKSIDTVISRRIIVIKSDIEKMREQVQNIE